MMAEFEGLGELARTLAGPLGLSLVGFTDDEKGTCVMAVRCSRSTELATLKDHDIVVLVRVKGERLARRCDGKVTFLPLPIGASDVERAIEGMRQELLARLSAPSRWAGAVVRSTGGLA